MAVWGSSYGFGVWVEGWGLGIRGSVSGLTVWVRD